MPRRDDAIVLILDHVTRAIIVADLAGLADVGLNLNQALVALGHPGISPDDDAPRGDRFTSHLVN